MLDTQMPVNSQRDHEKMPEHYRKITCDQVAWLLDIADRYLPKSKHVSVSREREMMKYGMLYEIMEIMDLYFEDDNARKNGTPADAR